MICDLLQCSTFYQLLSLDSSFSRFEPLNKLLRYILGLSYVVSGTRDSPPPEATLSSVYMWKRSLCRSSQSTPFMIIHNLHWIIRCTDIPFSLSFLVHSLAVGLAESILASLTRIPALNPKFRYYVILDTSRVVPVRRAKEFIWRKVAPLARVTLPGEVRQLAHPSCLAPRDGFANLM